MKADIVCVTDVVNSIGEGPLWSPKEKALYWVDAGNQDKVLLRFQTATHRTDVWTLSQRAASIARCGDGGLLVGFQKGLAVMNPIPDGVKELPLEGVDFGSERFNDSAIDRAGRLWIGTFDRALKAPLGCLYRIDPGLKVTKMAAGFTMSNGIAWSPDNRIMYFCDSRPGKIFAYDFDLPTGAIANGRVLMDFAGRGGRPDGCAMDSEGCLWVAEIDAGQIIRLTPDGRIEDTLELPVRRPTSVAFGGENLDTLFITSMTFGLNDQARSQQQFAGRLLAAKVDVRGLDDMTFDVRH